MKIWTGYGTEHSMNLVMIGHFNEVEDAAEVLHVIERIQEVARTQEEAGLLQPGGPLSDYPSWFSQLLREINFYSIGPNEVEQFLYEVSVDREDNRIVVHTDETDVSALMKLMVDRGGRVEVYSAHYHPDTPYGRRNRRSGENQ